MLRTGVHDPGAANVGSTMATTIGQYEQALSEDIEEGRSKEALLKERPATTSGDAEPGSAPGTDEGNWTVR